MSKTAAISGGAGDCVYAIQVMRALGVETVYVKESFYGPGEGSLYANLKPLLEVNGFKVLPTSGRYGMYDFEPGLQFDYNLDNFRFQPHRARVHIIKNQFRAFGLKVPRDYVQPWLKVKEGEDGHTAFWNKGITAISVTQRWRDGSKVNWRRVLDKIEGEPVFLGLEVDYLAFEKETGNPGIAWWKTKDLEYMARCIRDSRALYCNQGVALTLAQGIGTPYWCEFKPRRTNTMLFTNNEHILK